MNKRTIKYLLLLLIAFASPIVKAEDNKVDGIIKISEGVASKYICYYGVPSGSSSYSELGYLYHKYSFRFENDSSGKEYPAFCIKPGASVFINNSDGVLERGENAVTCSIMTPSDFPRVYSLIDEANSMWHYANESERDYYDFLLRIASVGDKYDDYKNKLSSYSNNPNMKSFLNSYSNDILGAGTLTKNIKNFKISK